MANFKKKLTPEAEAYLRKNWLKKSQIEHANYITTEFGIELSASAVAGHANRMELPSKRNPPPMKVVNGWSKEEEAALIANIHLPPEQLSAALPTRTPARTWMSIKGKIAELRRKGRLPLLVKVAKPKSVAPPKKDAPPPEPLVAPLWAHVLKPVTPKRSLECEYIIGSAATSHKCSDDRFKNYSWCKAHCAIVFANWEDILRKHEKAA